MFEYMTHDCGRDILTEILNKYAAEGWRLHTAFQRVGASHSICLIYEKEKIKTLQGQYIKQERS